MVEPVPGILQRLDATLSARRGSDPAGSYVAALYSKGVDAIARKVGEEAVEVILAAKEGDKLHIVQEMADLWFHSLVLLGNFGLSTQDVLAELARREGISGLEEKVARQSPRQT